MDTTDLSVAGPHERGDAVRNRARILSAARRLAEERGVDALTMDDVAKAAGVGKGTVFRRFTSRAGLMLALLDDDERTGQQAFMFGPPPLGPGAPPLDRLLAFGSARLHFVRTHRALLSEINRNPQTRSNAPIAVHRTHVRMLLAAAATSGDLETQADALLALLDADYVDQQLDRGRTVESLADGWADLARRLCGR